MDAYRFSISWTRIFPSKIFFFFFSPLFIKTSIFLLFCFLAYMQHYYMSQMEQGNQIQKESNTTTISQMPYQKKVSLSNILSTTKLYTYEANHFIVNSGIQPYATLFHWDLPQMLEDSYEGFLSNRIMYVLQRAYGLSEVKYKIFI